MTVTTASTKPAAMRATLESTAVRTAPQAKKQARPRTAGKRVKTFVRAAAIVLAVAAVAGLRYRRRAKALGL
jgi:carbohydrate-binding DOMON domain-containing protein